MKNRKKMTSEFQRWHTKIYSQVNNEEQNKHFRVFIFYPSVDFLKGLRNQEAQDKMYISKIICRIRRQIARIAITVIELRGFGLSLWYENDELMEKLWKIWKKEC